MIISDCLLVVAIVFVAFAAVFTGGIVISFAVTLAFEIISVIIVLAFSMRRLSLVGSAVDTVIVALQINNLTDQSNNSEVFILLNVLRETVGSRP